MTPKRKPKPLASSWTLTGRSVPPLGEVSPRTAWKVWLRSFILATGAILLTEFIIMVLLEPWFGANHIGMALFDSVALILICSPVLFFLFVKPMVNHLLVESQTKRALRAMESTNEFLRHEAETRIKAEKVELTKADARIQFQARVLSVVQQGVVATGKGGIILYWNRFAEWMFGWTAEEVQNQTLAKVTGFTLEAARNGISGMGAMKGWSGEVRAVRRDGTFFPAYLTCSPIWRDDGSVAGFVYTFIDVTDQKNAETAVRESEEKYSTLVESSPTGIFIYQDGRLEFANQRLLQMVGRSLRDLESLGLGHIIHPDDWPWVQESWQGRLAGVTAGQDSECRIVHSSREVRWVSGRTTLIRYRGRPALLGNIQDTTERHKAAEALLNSREALHRLSARLMSAQESERQRVARELHDSIGQSLSAVKFIVERAIDEQDARGYDTLGGSLRTVVPVIQGAVEEVRRISMALRPTTLDDIGLLATIAWFTREFQTAYPHMAVERVIELEEFEVPETLKTGIFRIMQEALNNAAKYSQATCITVALRQVLGDIQLVVADNGVGFVPGEPRKDTSGGGFGLVSMQERAELFGGSLILTTSPGEGTMVLARWPLPDEAIS